MFRLRMRILIAFILLSTPAAGLAKPAECTDPATGAKTVIRPGRAQRDLKALRRTMEKYGVHILDLPQAVQERHRNLPDFIANKDWCAVYAQVIAIEDALGRIHIDQSFISAKFTRVERLARSVNPATLPEIERMMAKAAAQMADRRFEKTNAVLNRVVTKVLGFSDVWRLPKSLPDSEVKATAEAKAPPIDAKEVEAGCPSFAKRGKATRENLASTLTRLGELMDRRSIRPFDLKGGEQLVADLTHYNKLSAIWPAARIACALIERTRQVEIDVGLVSKRFQRVRLMREKGQLSSDAEDRYTELVRSAGDHIGNKRFAEAHAELDSLLVLLGEPGRPSGALP
jgi:hypothetical protein